MICVSTGCVKADKIKDSVQQLVDAGFRNIELSGGTKLYDGFADDLLQLKEKYDLNYLCHNYFPPPPEPFVLNLASLDEHIFNLSFEHCKSAIDLSKQLGAKKYGLHAGFFLDIQVREIGKAITSKTIFDANLAVDQFCRGFAGLQDYADGVELYVENNVFSHTNARNYGRNVFMLTCYDEYQMLKKRLDFNLLVDVAHLKVSTNSLGLEFSSELQGMLAHSDYIHISDNDGLHDLNHALQKGSELFNLLSEANLENKDFTLEVYSGLEALQESYAALTEAIVQC